MAFYYLKINESDEFKKIIEDAKASIKEKVQKKINKLAKNEDSA